MALEVLAAVLGIRGPYRAGRGGELSPAWTAHGSRSTPACRICRYTGWSGPAGGQSARPDVSPVADNGRSERARRPPERAGGGLRPARPRVHRDLRGTDRLLRRAWPRPDSAPLGVHRRPRATQRTGPIHSVRARYRQRAGAQPVPPAGRQPGGWTSLGGGLTSEPPPATAPRPERRASWCSALPTCPGLRNGIWRPSPPGHAHAVATENGRAGGNWPVSLVPGERSCQARPATAPTMTTTPMAIR